MTDADESSALRAKLKEVLAKEKELELELHNQKCTWRALLMQFGEHRERCPAAEGPDANCRCGYAEAMRGERIVSAMDAEELEKPAKRDWGPIITAEVKGSGMTQEQLGAELERLHQELREKPPAKVCPHGFRYWAECPECFAASLQ